jgi:hypothetical protein
VKRRLTFFLGGAAAFWLLMALPAQLLGGRQSVAYSAAAMGICLVPATLSLILASSGPPSQQMVRVLGGTGLRMVGAIGGGLALYLTVPYFARFGFWAWMLVAYSFTLGWEVVLLVVERRALVQSSTGAAPRV